MIRIVFGILFGVSVGILRLFGEQQDCASSSQQILAAREHASILVASGHATEAVSSLKVAFGLCPTDVNIARELAFALMEAGDTGYSETLLKGLISRRDEAELHSLLGRALTIDKKNMDAAAQYQLAATMDPTEAHIFEFGTSLMKVNFGAAAEILHYGLRTYPASVKMHVALALALYAQDRSEEGAKLLLEASALDPTDVHPMEVLADTKIVPKSLQAEAERRLDTLRLRHAGNGLLLFDYTMVKSGRWSGEKTAKSPELIALLQRALALDPKLSKAHFELALVYEEEKNYAGEITELKQAIRLSSDTAQFHYRLAFAYRAIGDMRHCKEELASYSLLHSSAEEAPQ